MTKSSFYPENAVEQTILTPSDFGLPEIESVSFSRYTKNWQPAPPHIHRGCLELCYCRRGSLNFECTGESYTVLPNNIFLSQPGDLHRLTNNHKGVVCYWMVFKYPPRGQSIFDLQASESQTLVKKLRGINRHLFSADPALLDVFKEIFTVADSTDDHLRTLRLRILFLRVLLSLLDSANRAPTISGLHQITEIAKLMRNRPYHKFTTAEMAEHVNISESRFISLFRQIVGLPPHAYLISCRMNEAKRRLLDTEDSITQIAHDLGFSSAQHLSSQFFRIYRLSPSQFRQTRQPRTDR